MGLFDVLRGKRDLKQPASDRLFAMATAYVALEGSLGLKTTGSAAIVFQQLETADFATLAKDMQELIGATTEEAGTELETKADTFGYRWMILRDPDFEDLVTGINAISGELEVGGYGDRILAAGRDERVEGAALVVVDPVHALPGLVLEGEHGGEQQRDNERELRLKAQIGPELPLEPELERWFPLWDIPL